MKKTLEIDLEYQPFIDRPPKSPGELYGHAASSDTVTVNSWREIWTKNYQAANERFGDFGVHSIGQLHKADFQKPVIICGSGPSLKDSIQDLKKNAESRSKVTVVSCLHNFGYFEDEGFHADYYLSLDSGKIVLDDVSEGRKLKAEEYWEKTEGKVLLAAVASDPQLFEKWRGKIYLFNSLIPDIEIRNTYEAIQPFHHYISAGGNALGGCLYFAKMVLGCGPVMFVGADFCFDYTGQFHSYATHYDKYGHYVRWPDVFGLPRKTWPSYLNFKYWFDWVALTVPGQYISCSSGLLGAYPEGNIRQFSYMSLKEALVPYQMADTVHLKKMNALTNEDLGLESLDVSEYWGDAKNGKHIIFF